MAAYNAESTLARMLRPHYSRADDEARALLREAFTLSGDLHITGDTRTPGSIPPPHPAQPCPTRPLPAAHRDRNPLPRHQPDHQLQRQRPTRHFMI